MQVETLDEFNKIPQGTIARQSHLTGMDGGEPLIYGMDGLLRYAKAYRKHFDSHLCNDAVLGPCWLDAVKGLRGLLNGSGVVAMERNISTDSKDNGAVESVFWSALSEAGFTEGDI